MENPRLSSGAEAGTACNNNVGDRAAARQHHVEAPPDARTRQRAARHRD